MAARMENTPAQVLYEEIDESARMTKQVVSFNNNDEIYYIFVDESISYCAQIIGTDKIQFSYVKASDGIVVESEIYEIDAIYECAITNEQALVDDMYYDGLNGIIIANIDSFERVRRLDDLVEFPSAVTSGADSIEDAISEALGDEYFEMQKRQERRTYNGVEYLFRCYETKSSRYTTPDAQWFVKDLAFSAVVAWALAGSWSWIGAIEAILQSVTTTIVTSGVRRVVNDFQAERSNVSRVYTRKVMVDGDSRVQYWAGWTTSWYFFKGDLGWTHDTGPNSDVKHSDYEDLPGLIQQGYENYVNFILNS
jgi:hypothetical protein